MQNWNDVVIQTQIENNIQFQHFYFNHEKTPHKQ